MAKKKDFKKPKFTLDRTRRGDLARQIADGLRADIETGHYAPGDILPPVRELGKILGVSMGIAVQAVVRLREEGLISPRPSVGSVVCASDRPLWKGHVLLVIRGGYGGYYANTLIGVIRDKLIREGYLVSTAATPFGRDDRPDVTVLSAALKQSVDLAVVVFSNAAAERCIAASGVKFILVGDRPSKSRKCAASIVYDRSAAAESFVPELAKEGMRTLMEVGIEGYSDAGSAAKRAGLDYSLWTVACRPGLMPEAVEGGAMDAFAARLAGGRSWLPDVIYFQDDYVASGALKALMAAGVKIPDDVHVVAWSNRGCGPLFPFPVMLAQMNPYGDGEKVADTALASLRNLSEERRIVLGPVFIPVSM